MKNIILTVLLFSLMGHSVMAQDLSLQSPLQILAERKAELAELNSKLENAKKMSVGAPVMQVNLTIATASLIALLGVPKLSIAIVVAGAGFTYALVRMSKKQVEQLQAEIKIKMSEIDNLAMQVN